MKIVIMWRIVGVAKTVRTVSTLGNTWSLQPLTGNLQPLVKPSITSIFTRNLIQNRGISITATNWNKINHQEDEVKKPGLVQRFKQMYKDYWYVLVPVHLVTSAAWLGTFYYMAKSGVDVVALLNSLGVSESFTNHLKDSSLGYVALAYGLYKVATPVRYTVTLGGTTISIKYLQQWGYIKPMPSKAALKEMYQEKKESFQEKYNETRQELRQRKDQIRERKDHVMSDIAKYKQEMKDVKESEVKNKDV